MFLSIKFHYQDAHLLFFMLDQKKLYAILRDHFYFQQPWKENYLVMQPYSFIKMNFSNFLNYQVIEHL